MTTANLSQYETIRFEGFEKIRLDDFQVCELLQTYVIGAISWVERQDFLVQKLVISPDWVRAYVDPVPERLTVIPEFIEIQLPKGVYARAVDLSAGPLSPFPVYGPSEEVKLFLGRLQQAAFPALENGRPPKKVILPRHIITNAADGSVVRQWLGNRMDPCSTRDELLTGFQGVLFESEKAATNAYVDPHGGFGPIPPDTRSVKLWLSRLVPKGTVWTSGQQPAPNWDPQKVQIHDLTDKPVS